MAFEFNPFTQKLDIAGSGTGAVTYPYITPENYGAVGNGVADDTTAIQNAVNAANTLKKPLLCTATKTYAITNIAVPTRVSILGPVPCNNAPTFKGTAASAMFTLAGGGEDINFHNIRLDGNLTATSIIDGNGSNYVQIHNCIFIQSALGIDLTDTAIFWQINSNIINTQVGIQISSDTAKVLIYQNYFLRVQTTENKPIYIDSSSFADTIDIIENVFGNDDNGAGYCIDVNANVNYDARTGLIQNNRFDTDAPLAVINIGQRAQVDITGNSFGSAVVNHINCDGSNCKFTHNYHASSTGAAINLTANSANCQTLQQIWATGLSACASEYADAGTNNIRFDASRLDTDNAKILGLGDDGSLTGNDDLRWSDTYKNLQVNALGSGTGYYGAGILELAAPRGIGGQIYLTDDGTGTFTLAQQNSTGDFVIQSSDGTGDPAFKIDKDTDLVSVINELEVGGVKGVSVQAFIERDNDNYTNTDGEDSHLLVNNPNSTGQTVIASMIDGSLVTKWRTDYVGNISWCAYNPYSASSWYGAHYFYVNGDYPTGLCKMVMRSNCTDDSISGVAIGYSVVGMQPTAYLHLDAGDSAAHCAPLKFSVGTLLSSEEEGAIEYDGSYLYYTDDTATRYQIAALNDALTKRELTFVIDGGGSAITTGEKAWMRVPYACTITGWEITADVSGSIVIDVWKDTYANFPPTVADTIAGTEKPTLSSQTKNQDLSLSTWTTSVTAGDYIKIKVDSVATVTRVVLNILVTT